MMSRRSFLKDVLCAAGAYCLGGLFHTRNAGATTPSGPRLSQDKVLNLHNVHTGERLQAHYCAGDNYDEEALSQIHYILRCHYTNTVQPIDLKVIDLLCDVKDRLAGVDDEISIISGYRSPEYNEYLRCIGRHVAGGSMHLQGKAIDFAIPGLRTGELCRTASLLSAGGVGKYPDFIHIDVGRVRYW